MTVTLQKPCFRAVNLTMNGAIVKAGDLIEGRKYSVNTITGETAEAPAFTIHPIDKTQGRLWCGPTVLALLTGFDRATIHRDINKTIRYRDGTYKTTKRVPWSLTAPVKGLHEWQLEASFKKYGFKTTFKKNTDYSSLRRLVEDMGHFKHPIVITVTGHFVLYFAGKIYDTYRPDGEPIDTHPCAGRQVKNYWLIRGQKGGR